MEYIVPLVLVAAVGYVMYTRWQKNQKNKPEE